MFKRFVDWVFDRLSGGDRIEDNPEFRDYLNRSKNLADLETRIQELERIRERHPRFYYL